MPSQPKFASNPTVVITGASSGIGAAAAQVFAEAGYDVILAARRLPKLTELAASLTQKFPKQRILPVECDVCSDISVAQLFDRVRADFGILNVLVNNAGYGVYGSVEDTPIDAFRQNMDTNYLGLIRCTQRALPLLRVAAASPGKSAAIVMVSSIVGRRAIPRLSSYSATKFALEALSESLRVELRDERISVSVVNPGVTKTEFGHVAVGERPGAFLAPDQGMSSEAVARVILKAARSPARNRYLTLYGKLCVITQWLAPSLLDFILLRTWRQSKNQSAEV